MRRFYILAITGAMVLTIAQGPARADQKYEWKDGTWVAMVEPVEGTSAGELGIIRQHFAEGRHKKAVKAAKKFLKRYPSSPGREEVMMLAGQGQFERGRYYQAFEWFEKQLIAYPAGQYFQRSLKRQYEIAEAFLTGKKRIIGPLRLKATGEGLDILFRIAEHAPGSQLAQEALLRIGDYHYARRAWGEATEAYDQFLKLYGKSPHAPHAMLQAARASLSNFRGFAYDDTPLLEAEQRFRFLMERFPRTGEVAGAPKILANIMEMKAHKRYKEAEFYERTGRRRAAEAAYKRLIAESPISRWAYKAQQDLDRLAAGGKAKRARWPRFAALMRWRRRSNNAPTPESPIETQSAKKSEQDK